MEQIVTLLTDFGTADGYVATMKGVIMCMAPECRIMDATHEIPPQDIRAGAWALMQYWRWFPQRTIHIAVVDPGVGTGRDALLVRADGHWFLSPDNGLLSGVLRQARQVELRRLLPGVHHPSGRSATFHGRDVFAYVAGLLAQGASPHTISETTKSVVMPKWATVMVSKDRIVGEVIHVDRFGNLITNITRRLLDESGGSDYSVRLSGGPILQMCNTYGDGKEGELIALINSSDAVEIAVVNGSATERTQTGRGAIVEIILHGSTASA